MKMLVETGVTNCELYSTYLGLCGVVVAFTFFVDRCRVRRTSFITHAIY